MNASRVEEAPSDPVGSLAHLGETLAAGASLEQLGRLVVRRVRDALGARRVALLARHESPRLAAVADTAPEAVAGNGDAAALALPLGGAGVEAVLVVQDAAADARPALEAFRARIAPVISAVCAAGGDAAAARARIAGQVVHKINNRLGAIHIYAYLLAERLKKGGDASSVEVATKLCTAVDRLGAEVAALAAPGDALAAVERQPMRVDTAVERCLAALAPELPGGLRVVRDLGDAGSAAVHEPTLRAALGVLLGRFAPEAPVVVRTGRPSHAAEIAVEGVGGPALAPAVLFAGEAGDDTARALLCDLVERHSAVAAVTRAAGGRTTVRVALDAAGE